MFVNYCYIVVFARVVFFFKQKTAYEMRISDWSSDVCSSDLAEAEGMNPVAVAVVRLLVLTGMRRGEALGLRWPDIAADGASLRLREIGRASCRERVCQYV